MSELLTIEANARSKMGKNNNRRLRAAGMLPANLMEKGKSTPIELNPKLLSKIYKAGKTFNLSFNGVTKAVTIQELHIDRIKRTPLHIDLMYVD